MAMDRTMYGKVEPSDIYQPFRITMKKGSPPGYALLADLQNTVSSEGNHVGGNATPGYGSLNGARTHATTVYRSYDNRTSPLPPQSNAVMASICRRVSAAVVILGSGSATCDAIQFHG